MNSVHLWFNRLGGDLHTGQLAKQQLTYIQIEDIFLIDDTKYVFITLSGYQVYLHIVRSILMILRMLAIQ